MNATGEHVVARTAWFQRAPQKQQRQRQKADGGLVRQIVPDHGAVEAQAGPVADRIDIALGQQRARRRSHRVDNEVQKAQPGVPLMRQIMRNSVIGPRQSISPMTHVEGALTGTPQSFASSAVAAGTSGM